MNKEKLMIIDGNSILNRAFYGLQGPRLLSTKDGIITNAVFGFLNILFKYIEEEKPDMLWVAFDLKAPTFRHIEFEDYKAKRKGMPKELADQVPIIKEVLDAMNVKRIEIEGYEADDILGTISLIAEKEGKDVIIITGDRDSLQLSSDTTRVKIPVTKGGRTETEEYDRNAIFEKYGIEPVQLIDVKGLMGDASDNIPGVPGIGEKTGFELIKTFHSIENLYENIESVAKKGVKTKLEENKELAFKCKHLAAIHRSIPDIEGLEGMERQDYGGEKLLNLFTRLEFKSFIEKLNLNNIKDIEKKQKEDENLDVFHIEDREGLNDVKASIRSSGAVSIYYMADKTGSFYTTLFGLALTWRENQAAFICLNENFHEQTILDEFKEIWSTLEVILSLKMDEFKEILEDADIKKYGHDLKNLIVYLKGKGISIKGIAFDTMIAAYVVDPSRDTYTVSELAKEYLDKNLDPIENLIGKGRTFTPFASMKTEDLMMCSSGHSETIFKVKHKLDEVLKEHGQSCLFNGILTSWTKK